MTRGRGKIERAIIDAAEKEPGTLIPVLEIARDHRYDISKRAIAVSRNLLITPVSSDRRGDARKAAVITPG